MDRCRHRSSRDPGFPVKTERESLYFNQNAYTADGKKLIVTTAGGGIATIFWQLAKCNRWSQVRSRCSWRVTRPAMCTKANGCRAARTPRPAGAMPTEPSYTQPMWIRAPRARWSNCRPGRDCLIPERGRDLSAGHVCGRHTPRAPAANRQPGDSARFGQLNYEAVGADGKPMTFADAKDLRLHNSLMATRAGAPRVLFTVSTKTGELKDIFREHEWLGHLQFSPTPSATSSCSATKVHGTRWTASGRSTPTARA